MNTNLEQAYKLKDEAVSWFRQSFNSIPLDVFEREAEHFGNSGSGLMEFIPGPEFDLTDEEEFAEALKFLDLDAGDEDLDEDEVESLLIESRDSSYPMWGTVFESSEGIDTELAKAAGFTVIEAFGSFHTALGVAGAGYSFHSAHIIPLWLSMPWNSLGREKYEGVNYEGM